MILASAARNTLYADSHKKYTALDIAESLGLPIDTVCNWIGEMGLQSDSGIYDWTAPFILKGHMFELNSAEYDKVEGYEKE
jgi:hypothetical protein